jgi:hypothetical protein
VGKYGEQKVRDVLPKPQIEQGCVKRNMCDVVLWLVTDREVALEEFSPYRPS